MCMHNTQFHKDGHVPMMPRLFRVASDIVCLWCGLGAYTLRAKRTETTLMA